MFLGLAGEQWREHTRHRELVVQALQRFRAEIGENRAAVVAVKDYHVTMQRALRAAFDRKAAGVPDKDQPRLNFQGVRPARFDHSAWDLAIATQSLADIEPHLALSLSKSYNLQDTITDLTRGVSQSMYIAPPVAGSDSTFLAAVLLDYGDITIWEPRLIQMYDDVLKDIDAALAGAK